MGHRRETPERLQLGALLCAVTAELVDLVTAADAERDWRVDGATGMAPWLVGTLHVSSATAKAWVRAGTALDGLPHLREAFGAGVLSWDQVSPASTFVTPERDEEIVDGPDGTTVGIGRADRSIPRWLRRRIRRRDGGCCQFPGCGRRIRQVHHIRHWTRDEGPTDAWNLCGLCWYHHRVVHEGGWTIQGNADGELTFRSPYGKVLRSRPQPLKSDVRSRAAHAAGVRLDTDPKHPAA
jgi:hypothetical protein